MTEKVKDSTIIYYKHRIKSLEYRCSDLEAQLLEKQSELDYLREIRRREKRMTRKQGALLEHAYTLERTVNEIKHHAMHKDTTIGDVKRYILDIERVLEGLESIIKDTENT